MGEGIPMSDACAEVLEKAGMGGLVGWMVFLEIGDFKIWENWSGGWFDGVLWNGMIGGVFIDGCRVVGYDWFGKGAWVFWGIGNLDSASLGATAALVFVGYGVFLPVDESLILDIKAQF